MVENMKLSDKCPKHTQAIGNSFETVWNYTHNGDSPLFNEYKNSKNIRKAQKHEDVMKAIEASIYLNYSESTTNYVRIQRDTSIKKSVIDWLCEQEVLKFIERGQKGNQFSQYKVMRPMIGVGMISKHRDHVLVKDANKKVLSLDQVKNQRAYNTAKSDLLKINNHINKANITINDTPLIIGLYRIFRGASMMEGGRFYDEYIWEKRIMRGAIEIDGDAVVEVDFKSMYAALMYAKIGIQLTEDAYAIDGFDRDEVKKVFTRSVAIEEEDLQGLNNYTFDIPKHRVLEIMDAIKVKHSKIADRLLNPNTCHELMYQESYLMNKILLSSVEEDVYLLPVHDSVICKKKDIEQVISLINRVTLTRYGFTLPISVKDQKDVLCKKNTYNLHLLYIQQLTNNKQYNTMI